MTKMLTAKDMQALLQVDRSTIYRMAEARRLPAVKVGKQWRFPRTKVEQWLQSQSVIPHTAAESSAMATTGSSSDLASLLPFECVQLIQDTFADILNVMIVITDMEGNPITRVSYPCGLFASIQDIPNAVQKCIESWKTLAQTIELEPKFMPSHLGLLCTRGMIRVGRELKGMVVVGCIAPDDWPPPENQIRKIAEELEISTDIIAPHFKEAFYLTKEEQQLVLIMVQRIANIVGHIASERHSFMEKLESISKSVN